MGVAPCPGGAKPRLSGGNRRIRSAAGRGKACRSGRRQTYGKSDSGRYPHDAPKSEDHGTKTAYCFSGRFRTHEDNVMATTRSLTIGLLTGVTAVCLLWAAPMSARGLQSHDSIRHAAADFAFEQALGQTDRQPVVKAGRLDSRLRLAPVSYTHLTLPTICSV